MVPGSASPHDALLDATIAVLTDLYEDGPSFREVAAVLPGGDMLDFTDPESVPHSWSRHREEARSHFANLIIYEANLVSLKR